MVDTEEKMQVKRSQVTHLEVSFQVAEGNPRQVDSGAGDLNHGTRIATICGVQKAARQCLESFTQTLQLDPHNSWMRFPLLSPLLQVMKLRHKEVKKVVQGHRLMRSSDR